MTIEEFDDIKEEYINTIKSYMAGESGIEPHITIFADKLEKSDEEDYRSSIIHMPIPTTLMQSEEAKDTLIDEVLPKVMKEVKKKFEPFGIAWTSEAWVRKAERDADLNDWKQLPIEKEILMVNIESKFGNEMLVYEIKRNGMKVTEDGLRDEIELIKDDNLSQNTESVQGRFTGLYKKLIKNYD